MGGAAGGRGLPVDKRCEAQRKEARSAKKEGRGVLIKNGKAEVAYSRLIGRDTRYPFNRALKKKNHHHPYAYGLGGERLVRERRGS